MSSREKIQLKISSVQKYLAIVKRYEKYSVEQIKKDVDIRGMVERYVYLVAQSTIDLAETVIAYKRFRKPTTYSECFNILEENGIIKLDITERLANMAGFRNVIAHDYKDINYNIVYNVIHEGVKDLKKFVNIISKLK